MAITNHLQPFSGCLVGWLVVSPGVASEGNSHWTFFDGNYQEYEADKRKRLGE
jgi:hypothetical protein